MNDRDCITFLQWALPKRDLRWPGFRKVRGQVCKRLKRRAHDLGLPDLAAYQARLEADPDEWRVFDDCCHITISRFFRDRGVFAALRERVLPDIAARGDRERRPARIWSAGCASGEEPYTLKILWDLDVAESHAGVPVSITATDVDEAVLARAREACFEATSLHEMPPEIAARAFDRIGGRFCVRPRHRDGIEFLPQDLRFEAPNPPFDLILCRYLAFTYFALPLQRAVLARMVDCLLPNGYLVIGTHERLPDGDDALMPLAGAPQVFSKRSAR